MLSIFPDMVKESLAKYVKRVRQGKKMSLVDVERESRRHGQGISNGYVSQIENGLMTNPTIDALSGLAKGLGVSEDEVFAAARGLLPTVTGQGDDEREALRKLLLFYFDNAPEERWIYMLGAVKGIYEYQNEATKTGNRSKDAAATTSQQPRHTNREAEEEAA